jgi:alkanesulfonate monooxygenase SsuD/methylene tetrahydromethanopterin reductase-like flavin-dependent oxidoreductase (luciferase family)
MAEECERARAEVGRDPATLRRTWGGGCVCAPTQAEAEAIAGGRYDADSAFDDFDFVGTPQQVVAQMRPFIDMSVDYFNVDCGGFPNLTTLELLINEVLPALNDLQGYHYCCGAGWRHPATSLPHKRSYLEGCGLRTSTDADVASAPAHC